MSEAPPNEPPEVTGRRGLSLSRTARMALKELREVLRDRRTIITLVLMPVLVYPVLSVAFHRFLLTSALEATNDSDFVIGVRSEYEQQMLSQYLGIAGAIVQRNMQDPENKKKQSETKQKIKPVLQAGPPNGPQVRIEYRIVASLETAVKEVDIDLGVAITESGTIQDGTRQGKAIRCELFFRQNSVTALQARQFVTQRMQIINLDYARARLVGKGIAPTLPVTTSFQAVQGEIPFSLAALVPLILILMTSTGAVYPAIEVTAGERERGTLESLIAAPVPRLSLLLAKFVAVITVATITATVNVTAMLVTVTTSGLAGYLFGPAGVTLTTTAQIFFLLILFATFFSAMSLALTSFARSFKEAQAYLIPLMLISIAPGLFSLLPQAELAGVWMVIPLVNIVLLARDVCQSTVQPFAAIVAVLTSLVYTLQAVAFAARIFGSDALLYGSGGSWSELLRRPLQLRTAPTITTAMGCLAVMFPIYFVMTGLIQSSGVDSMAGRLLLGSLVTALLFGLFPLTVALNRRVNLLDGFTLRRSKLLNWLGAIVFGIATWPFVHELIVTAHERGWTTISAETIEAVQAVAASWQEIPLPLILFTVAMAPAFFEELFFRGFLMNALRRKMNTATAVVLAAVFFGVFHVLTSAGAPERFLPSTFLGIILGWVCVRSGSVLPSMAMHFCNNGLLVLVTYYKDEIEQLSFLGASKIEAQIHLPVPWLMAAWLGVAAAVLLLLASGKPDNP